LPVERAGLPAEPISDNDDDFEILWACERTGTPVAVTADDCGRCPHWSPERDLRPVKGRRR
jgi:hypothetical protein